MKLISALTLTIARYYNSATELSTSKFLLNLLELSHARKSPSLTKQCHAKIFSLGFFQNPFLATKIISVYANYGHPSASQLVFDSLQYKSVCLWNSLINGYVRNCDYMRAFSLFCEMCFGNGGLLPDDYTFPTVLKACSEMGWIYEGRLIHGRCLRVGFVSVVIVANSILSMYSKCGEFGAFLKLFDEMPKRNVSSWNLVISAFIDSFAGSLDHEMEVWDFVKRMLSEGLRPDAYTLSILLSVCDGRNGWDYGRELHGFIVRNELGFEFSSGLDAHLVRSLIDMYSKSGKVFVGKQVFDQTRFRNVYAWTAMINGYVQNGCFDEAFVLFHKMQFEDGVEPNRVSLVSVLPACSAMNSLICGKQVHGYAIRNELNVDMSLRNALIDMYAKCGNLKYARLVFEDDSFSKDAISWSSMISAYGLHGKGEDAVAVYHKMLQLGNKPDAITVVGVLSACSRSGLTEDGLKIYESAVNEYGVSTTAEIYSCVVDMLGRAGRLCQALDFIKKLPVEPGASVWGALVSSSILHGNSEMYDFAYRSLIELEPENPSNYVSLSNVHATSRRWDVVAEVRTMMKEMGLRKTPGCSWISINNTTHCFHASDTMHCHSKLIYETLNILAPLMKGPGHCHFPDYMGFT